MWLTFILAIIIGAVWISKMIVQRQFKIQRTPLDIPIILFLLSQIFSTLFSLDSHISWWGYYSRFNGGLLSTITYIFLYYALVSHANADNKHSKSKTNRVSFFMRIALFSAGIFVLLIGFPIAAQFSSTSSTSSASSMTMLLFEIIAFFLFNFTTQGGFINRILQISFISGFIVSLWGLPGHFGYDPTCYVFRGTFDVNCWTAAFQPKARIFSTLGQPDWMGSYLLILIPIAIAYALKSSKKFYFGIYFILTGLFYLDFLYTRSKGNFVALVLSLIIFFVFLFWYWRKNLNTIFIIRNASFIVLFLLITFFAKTPFNQFDKFSWDTIMQKFSPPAPPAKTQTKISAVSQHSQERANAITGEFGGTDSGKIRLFVWKGAIDAWKNNPLFGTGVETFAFAYYKYRPVGHNLTSEWDYLYNKAHNEYLDYLTTTGAFGLGTYLVIIGVALFLFFKKLPSKSEVRLLVIALLTGYVTIVISNFFGFSVVIVNMYFFLIPAFVLMLTDSLNPNHALSLSKFQSTTDNVQSIHSGQWISISVIWLIGLYLMGVLINYWFADKAYGLGLNYDHAGQYQAAYPLLHQAVDARSDEPIFKDEMSINDTALALGAAAQKDATVAAKLANEALQASNDITTNYPNNLVFWKSRVRIMYSLSEVDPRYLPAALQAIQKAHDLAPTDAKISYNFGLLLGQTGNTDKAVQILQETTQMKPDYKDAFYALGVMLHDQAVDKDTKKLKDPEKEKQAVAALHYIVDKLSPGDKQAQDTLKSWGEK